MHRLGKRLGLIIFDPLGLDWSWTGSWIGCNAWRFHSGRLNYWQDQRSGPSARSCFECSIEELPVLRFKLQCPEVTAKLRQLNLKNLNLTYFPNMCSGVECCDVNRWLSLQVLRTVCDLLMRRRLVSGVNLTWRCWRCKCKEFGGSGIF